MKCRSPCQKVDWVIWLRMLQIVGETKTMDIPGLRSLCRGRFFEGWDGFVDSERVASSEASVRQLIDDLLALGPKLSEETARDAVDACVRRFNDLDDDGWICTIEREDIYEQVGRVIDLCGYEYGEEWVDERDW